MKIKKPAHRQAKFYGENFVTVDTINPHLSHFKILPLKEIIFFSGCLHSFCDFLIKSFLFLQRSEIFLSTFLISFFTFLNISGISFQEKLPLILLQKKHSDKSKKNIFI
ncbi:MAG: hypothetical protein COV30_00850 [Candidatus Yanofskybacteria bacterium CG10_big_fil_rev_8_21_14_0_10_37_15]|uniref:Uncharacterized protein n=1 Tax=Candidatus Yanofskybacteria bacterium CG10_big_fil_rev_8_21_14_0_10_37_15 TaxID=1975097 RepID=A0A2H0R632_9BACT|nr:MAG: hypothetical protein COV30_00850 [Candidatus Yanofskybacteria bacterium CG10_big_fil_rev_8_21_14_0_10_37_15]